MTLNQVISRIRQISLAHKQVQSFGAGMIQDFLTEKTTKYPAVWLQDNGGSISLGGHATTLAYKLFFVDLVHVSEDTKDNQQDVQSDMISVAMDILAQLANPNYNDWMISLDNNLQLLFEAGDDMYAGVVIDFSVRIIYPRNVCEVPTAIINYVPSGARVKITIDKDMVTGEFTLLLTPMPTDQENNTPTAQDLTITDFLKGIVLKTNDGTQVRLTAFQDPDTNELQLILTEL